MHSYWKKFRCLQRLVLVSWVGQSLPHCGQLKRLPCPIDNRALKIQFQKQPARLAFKSTFAYFNLLSVWPEGFAPSVTSVSWPISKPPVFISTCPPSSSLLLPTRDLLLPTRDLLLPTRDSEWPEKMNDFPSARDAYERLLKVNPDSPFALNNLAYLYPSVLANSTRPIISPRRPENCCRPNP